MKFFSNKPSRAERAKWLALSQNVMPIFERLAVTGAVLFPDGRGVDFKDQSQREEVLSAVQKIVSELGLCEISPYTAEGTFSRSKLIHDRCNASTYEGNGPIVETAEGIVMGLDAHEALSSLHASMYPHFEPLREMLDNTGMIIEQALDPLLDVSLPEFIRLAFPQFSGFFQKNHYRF